MEQIVYIKKKKLPYSVKEASSCGKIQQIKCDGEITWLDITGPS